MRSCDGIDIPGLDKCCRRCEHRLQCLVRPEELLEYRIRQQVEAALTPHLNTPFGPHSHATVQAALERILYSQQGGGIAEIQHFNDVSITDHGNGHLSVSVTVTPKWSMNHIKVQLDMLDEQ